MYDSLSMSAAIAQQNAMFANSRSYANSLSAAYGFDPRAQGGPSIPYTPISYAGSWSGSQRNERWGAMAGAAGVTLGGAGMGVMGGMMAARAFGAGSFGAMAGGMVAGMGAAMLPMTVASIATEGIAERATVMGMVGTQYGGFSSNARGGTGFGTGGRRQIADTVRQLNNIPELMTSMGELTTILSKIERTGTMYGVTDATRFADRFKKAVNSLRQISKVIGGTMEDALSLVGESRSTGFYTASDILGNAAQRRTTGAILGMSQAQVGSLQSSGAALARSMGGLGVQGAGGINRIAQNVQMAVRMGTMSPEMLSEITGGLQGADAAASWAQTLQGVGARMSGSAIGRLFTVGFGKRDKEGRFTGEYDTDAMSRWTARGSDYRELWDKGMRGMNREGMVSFVAKKGQLQAGLMEHMPELVSGMFNQISKQYGYGSEAANLLIQRRTGMDYTQVEAMRSMAAQMPALRAGRAALGGQAEQTALDNVMMRERSFQGLVDRLKKGLEVGLIEPIKEAGEGVGDQMVDIFDRLEHKLFDRPRAIGSDQYGGPVAGVGGRGSAAFAGFAGGGGMFADGAGLGGGGVSQVLGDYGGWWKGKAGSRYEDYLQTTGMAPGSASAGQFLGGKGALADFLADDPESGRFLSSMARSITDASFNQNPSTWNDPNVRSRGAALMARQLQGASGGVAAFIKRSATGGLSQDQVRRDIAARMFSLEGAGLEGMEGIGDVTLDNVADVRAKAYSNLGEKLSRNKSSGGSIIGLGYGGGSFGSIASTGSSAVQKLFSGGTASLGARIAAAASTGKWGGMESYQKLLMNSSGGFNAPTNISESAAKALGLTQEQAGTLSEVAVRASKDKEGISGDLARLAQAERLELGSALGAEYGKRADRYNTLEASGGIDKLVEGGSLSKDQAGLIRSHMRTLRGLSKDGAVSSAELETARKSMGSLDSIITGDIGDAALTALAGTGVTEAVASYRANMGAAKKLYDPKTSGAMQREILSSGATGLPADLQQELLRMSEGKWGIQGTLSKEGISNVVRDYARDLSTERGTGDVVATFTQGVNDAGKSLSTMADSITKMVTANTQFTEAVGAIHGLKQ